MWLAVAPGRFLSLSCHGPGTFKAHERLAGLAGTNLKSLGYRRELAHGEWPEMYCPSEVAPEPASTLPVSRRPDRKLVV